VGGTALDLAEIVGRLQAALREHSPALAARDALDELVRRPADLDATLEARFGPLTAGGIETLHHAPDLTVLRIAWTPGMSLYPHEHRMWAVVGMYGGQEDNAFYRRSPRGLQPAGGRGLPAGEVLVMGDDAIHAVANPRRQFAVAIHVYGGDFFGADRSEWDPATFEERPRDMQRTRRLFDEANAAWRRESRADPTL
jgi:predicted metal-dependent enzyme (double-stranded beta helix superfamily)